MEYSSIIMLVLLLVVFYFMLIRPENKRKKAAQEMRNSLKKGDKLTTIGGIVGTIVQVKDDTLIIETSEDRVRMEITKWAVSTTGVQTTADAQQNTGKNSKKELSDDVPEEPVDEIPAPEKEQEAASAEEPKD
jgi:preprotein translocase subunit YajC